MTDPEQAQQLLEQEESAEDLKERLEREHGELVEELRALIPGAEVLLGFLLAIRFTSAFDSLDDSQRYVYYFTFACTSTALVLYLATSAHHRLRFRAGDKEFSVRKGNRDAIAGTIAGGVRAHERRLPPDRPHLRHAAGDRRRARDLHAHRLALVGARAVPGLAGPAGSRGRAQTSLKRCGQVRAGTVGARTPGSGAPLVSSFSIRSRRRTQRNCSAISRASAMSGAASSLRSSATSDAA